MDDPKKKQQQILKYFEKHPEIRKKLIKKLSKKIKEKPESKKEIKTAYKHHLSLVTKFTPEKVKVALYPNDHFSNEDIAFGILTNGIFLCVEDHPELKNKDKGYASHGLLLQINGFTEDMHDPNPKVDYRVRGIVKAEMGGNVVFWETPEEIVEDKVKFSAVKKCLKELKRRKLIKNDTEVHGSGKGGNTSIGLVKSFLGD